MEASPTRWLSLSLPILTLASGCLVDAPTQPCTQDDACANDEVCVDGTCEVRDCDPACEAGFVCAHAQCLCEEDAACGEGRRCDAGRCVDDTPPPECRSDAECASGFTCVDGSCQCGSDDACGMGQVCDAGACREATACTTDDECAAEGRVCTGGACVTPCERAADCGTPEVAWACEAGHCLRRCLSDAQCGSQEICEPFEQAGACRPAQCATLTDCAAGELCSDAEHGRCEAAIPCADDSECAFEQHCGLPDPCPPGFDCSVGNEICIDREPCTSDEDCGEGRYCNLDYCFDSTPCTSRAECGPEQDCVGGGCVPFVCRGPDDCGAGEICSGGSCITPPPPPAVDRVSILSPGGVILEGETRTLVAVAYDAAGNAIVGAPIQWSSDAPDSVSVSADGVATGGSTPGTATLTASFSGESDTVTLTLLPPAPAGRRVVVVDAEDGSLISGALVRLEPDGLEATTDADGVAVFAAGGPSDVHVFSDAHDYVTIAQNTADDLLVALPRRTRSDRAGGITGGILFDRVRTQGEISVGLAGLSLGQSLPDVDLVSLMGEVFVIHLDFGGQTQDVPLPGGMVAEAEFNGFPFSIKNRFYARGRDGLRAAWAFAGRLSFDRFSGGGSATARLSRILPLFSLFEHGLVPRILVSEMDTVVDTGDIDGDGDTTERVPDWNAFPARNLTPAQTQTLRVHVDPPAMPTYQGAPTDAVVLLAGNRLGRLGLLPLGLSATELPQNGGTEAPPVTMKLAPVYGGLEAGVYQLLALAVPFGDTSSGNFDAPREASVRVVTATTLPPDLQLDSFLPFASGSYDAASRTLQADAVPGASLTRFVLAAPEGRWIVYGQGALSETLPAPPAGFADLAAEATASVSPIQLRSDLSADNLLSPAGPTLVDLDTVTTAYSRVNLP